MLIRAASSRCRRALSSAGCRALSTSASSSKIKGICIDLDCLRRAGSDDTGDHVALQRDTEFFFRKRNKGRGELNISGMPEPTSGQKYAAKIRAKKMAAAARASSQSGLQSLSAAPHDSASSDVDGTDPLLWAVQNGAIELVQYLKMRSIGVALLLSHPVDEPFPADAFLKQLGSRGTAARSGASSSSNANDAIGVTVDAARLAVLPAAEPVTYACQQLGLPAVEVMVVGSNPSVLEAGKAAGCHVTHIKGRNDRRSQHAHHHVASFLDFQTVLERYNGISYRNAGEYIHVTKFGLGE